MANAKENLPEVQEETKNELTTETADLTALYGDTESFAADEMTVPFIKVAQKISPHVDKDNGEYIEGLEPGMIFNAGTGELWNEENPCAIVISKVQKELTEWWPRTSKKGSGLVHNYGSDLSPLNNPELKKNDKGQMETPEGTILVEAIQYYVQIVDLEQGLGTPAVISMSSTNMKAARDLNLMIRTQKLQLPNGKVIVGPAPYAFVYKLSSVKRQDDQNTWYIFKAVAAGKTEDLPNGPQLVRDAADFRKAVEGGQVQGDMAQETSSDADDDNTPF